MSTFDSTKRLLPEILADITKGKIQLPDFQRGWVWDDDHIRSLLVSVARSFPVGAVMLLETGGETRFQVRPVEGVSLPPDGPDAELLILDGQQRLTTLTQVLASQSSVKTRTDNGKSIERHYYWHIPTALEGGERLDDAIIATDDDRVLRTNFGRDVVLDLSTTRNECSLLYFPCDQILNSDEWEEALQEYAQEHFALYIKFRKEVLSAFRNYQLPVIQLGRATSKEAVCLVFEKVNTGGVPLNVFELVTATYAAEGFNLRDDWLGNARRRIAGRFPRLREDAVLTLVESTDFLQAVSMLHTLEQRVADLAVGKTGKAVQPVSAKRASILSMPLSAYVKWADDVEMGFVAAAQFLRMECITKPRELPYRTQLAPLAAIMAQLKRRWLEPVIYTKLSQWFWCGVLGELYGGAIETRIANDVEDVLAWIESDKSTPRTVADAVFNSDRLDRMSSRLSAAYKGLNVLLLREGAHDFFWKAEIRALDQEELALDIHHIFPQSWCENNGIRRAAFNSVVNKTPISYKANRMIGGQPPSNYVRKLQTHKQVQLGDAEMNAILASRRIDAGSLRRDDFERFYARRKSALIELIEQAMGKKSPAPSATSMLSEEESSDEDASFELRPPSSPSGELFNH
ncbi:hypothetical protein AWB70_00883 [Caballeronia cordobensis]|uniref:GmrSD restriction endonucleases N-terminal domain-containing protein n=1 Tax=Caballeronia cordobensis TaxID=1353886 RepID=A0A158FG72_CABCO|nr:DUF262 domain-containing protein [Caballeronia cordobensis]SAL18872.1 hypothetical protein AWB70_00883 [Caballeronia cordobensis]